MRLYLLDKKARKMKKKNFFLLYCLILLKLISAEDSPDKRSWVRTLTVAAKHIIRTYLDSPGPWKKIFFALFSYVYFTASSFLCCHVILRKKAKINPSCCRSTIQNSQNKVNICGNTPTNWIASFVCRLHIPADGVAIDVRMNIFCGSWGLTVKQTGLSSFR